MNPLHQGTSIKCPARVEMMTGMFVVVKVRYPSSNSSITWPTSSCGRAPCRDVAGDGIAGLIVEAGAPIGTGMGASETPIQFPMHPHKSAVSHADNHLLHPPIFRRILINPVVFRTTKRSKLQLDSANCRHRGHRSQRRSGSVATFGSLKGCGRRDYSP